MPTYRVGTSTVDYLLPGAKRVALEQMKKLYADFGEGHWLAEPLFIYRCRKDGHCTPHLRLDHLGHGRFNFSSARTRVGRQKCVHCDLPSIPGMKRGQGLCQKHWNQLQGWE